MSVELDPVELGFRRPFTTEVSETLRLKNPNSDPVAFKVKTTAPKQYCVRPNSGRIEPGQSVEVQVLLQAMKEDPPMDAKCRDKFLVQSVAVASADRDSTNVAAIWSNIEQTAKSSIQEKKIRVNFLSEDGTSASTPARSSMHYNEELPSYDSPGVTSSTPPQQSTAGSLGGSMSYIDSLRPNGASDSKSSVNGAQSTLGAAADSISNAVSSSTEEVKNQLAAAQATISRLTQQIQDQGLRQRKTETSTDNTSVKSSSSVTAQVQNVASSGVPVPLVAALCLLSFLLAYFLF